MSFGLRRNAPSTFQRFMNNVLSDLPFVFCYIDDILIAGDSISEHEKHLEIVFERLHKYGLSVNFVKLKFFF